MYFRQYLFYNKNYSYSCKMSNPSLANSSSQIKTNFYKTVNFK